MERFAGRCYAPSMRLPTIAFPARIALLSGIASLITGCAQWGGEVLKDNHKLRGVHSKESIKAILEKEALKQMQLSPY